MATIECSTTTQRIGAVARSLHLPSIRCRAPPRRPSVRASNTDSDQISTNNTEETNNRPPFTMLSRPLRLPATSAFATQSPTCRFLQVIHRRTRSATHHSSGQRHTKTSADILRLRRCNYCSGSLLKLVSYSSSCFAFMVTNM